MRLGVLDVGSNTVHLLIVDARHGGAPVPAHSHKIELRLAESLDARGNISAEGAAKLSGFVSESLAVAEDAGVASIMGFATSAIREAPNGEQVIDQVHDATGVRLELLSGEDEGRLTFLAVRRWFGWSSGRLIVFDIGGGSLEIAVGSDEEPDDAISLELGAGRLTRAHISGAPADPEEVRALRRLIRTEMADVVSSIDRLGPPDLAVATSKTFRQLARITGAAARADLGLAGRASRLQCDDTDRKAVAR